MKKFEIEVDVIMNWVVEAESEEEARAMIAELVSDELYRTTEFDGYCVEDGARVFEK